MPDSKVDQLTPREREVLMLVTYDRTTDVIAHLLNRSPNTVEAHIKSARRKLGNVDRFTAASILRQAEGHQPLANQPTAMARLSDSHPTTLRSGDASGAIAPDAASGETRHDTPNLITVPYVLGVALKIVVLALTIAMLAVITPLLVESARLTFAHLFASKP